MRLARTVFPPITVYGGWGGETVVCGERAGFACARATSTLLTAVLLLQRNVFGVVLVGFAARVRLFLSGFRIRLRHGVLPRQHPILVYGRSVPPIGIDILFE